MWTSISRVRKNDLSSGTQATTPTCHWLPSQRTRPFVTSSSQTCCQDTQSSDGRPTGTGPLPPLPDASRSHLDRPPHPTRPSFHKLLFENVDTDAPGRFRVSATVCPARWLRSRGPALPRAEENSLSLRHQAPWGTGDKARPPPPFAEPREPAGHTCTPGTGVPWFATKRCPLLTSPSRDSSTADRKQRSHDV